MLRVALRTLELKTAEERLWIEVRESVRRCAAADKRGNQSNFVHEAGYTSTIVILRFRLRTGEGGVDRDQLLLGQLIAVVNESFSHEMGCHSALHLPPNFRPFFLLAGRAR